MIKAKELRKGNIVRFEKPVHVQLGEIHANGIVELGSYGVHLVDADPKTKVHPIELSPEILEASGFELIEEPGEVPEEYWRHKEYTEFQIWDFNGECWVLQMADQAGISHDHIKHLHQIQNLFFFITDSELQVNINQKV